jgi:hypothetical protein
MKNTKFLRLTTIILFALTIGASFGLAQTADFTYQGRLLDSSLAANGNYDFQFSLYDAQSNGTLLGTRTRSGVAVSSGIFTVRLDFPAGSFDGTDRFLEISVKPTGGPNLYTVLAPRQPITSAPYSLRSLNAATADLATNSDQLGGIPSDGFIHNGTTQQGGSDFNISGNGTLGGTLSATSVNAASAYEISGSQVLSAPDDNLFVGPAAGLANTIGEENTFVGNFAGRQNTTGNGNSFFGKSAGWVNTFGTSNSFFGTAAGLANVAGTGNSFFGAGSGHFSTGDTNSALGIVAGPVGNLTNTTAIGAYAQVTQNNSLVLGGINGVNGATADTTVGIGTTAPKAPLHVAGSGTNVLVGSVAAGCAPGYAGVGFGSSLNCLNVSLVGNGTDTTINRPTGGSIYFMQNAVPEAGLSPAGNLSVNNKVGIGTAAPNAKLHIAETGTNVLIGSVAAGCAPGYAVVGFGTTLNCLNVSLVGNGTDTTINRPTGGSIYFMQNAVPEAGISPAGNLSVNNKVGIGTAAPNARLHIAANGGNVLAGNPIACNPGYAGIGFAASLTCNNYSLLGEGQNTIINRPTGGTITFRENNTPQMTINAGGTVSIHTLGSTGFLQLCINVSDEISPCASSLRYKTNINPFTSGISLIKKLKPITFDWKDGGMHDLGFGAEDVAAVEPLLVIHNKKGEVEGVKYDRISTVLVNAVKEQQAQIEEQSRQIKDLQSVVDKLQQRRSPAKRAPARISKTKAAPSQRVAAHRTAK